MNLENEKFYEIMCVECSHKSKIMSEHDLFIPPYSEKLICSNCNKRNLSILNVASFEEGVISLFEEPRLEVTQAEDPYDPVDEDPYYGALSEDTPNGSITSMDELTPN